MRAAIEVAVAALAVLLFLVTPAGATPTAGPAWGATAPGGTQVPSGMPMILFVYGPPNGTFHVAVNEQPFNSSLPVLTQDFRLSARVNLTQGGVGYSTLGVSLPSSQLDYGPVQVRVWNDTFGSFSWTEFRIVDAVNVTNLWLNEQQLWQDWNTSQARQIALLNAQGQQTAMWQTMAVVFGIGWGSILFHWTFTQTRLSETTFGIKYRRFWHLIGWTKDYVGPYMDTGEKEPDPVLTPDTTCVSRFFPECGTCPIPTSETEKVDHLVSVHHIPNPQRGLHYERDWREVRRRAASVKVAKPDPARVRQVARESVLSGGFGG